MTQIEFYFLLWLILMYIIFVVVVVVLLNRWKNPHNTSSKIKALMYRLGLK